MSRSAIDNSESGRWFRRGPWETLAMTLIAGGIVMMVQPWSIDLYSYSFVVILAGTLGFVPDTG